MADQHQRIKLRLDLLRTAAEIGNVSEACRLLNCSRDTYYRLRNAVLERGVDAVVPVERTRPNFKNRVSPEVEEAVLALSKAKPSYGKARIAAELKRRGVVVSASGVAGIWKRHGLEKYEKRMSTPSLRRLINTEYHVGSAEPASRLNVKPGELLIADISELSLILDNGAEMAQSLVLCLVIDVESRYLWARVVERDSVDSVNEVGREGIVNFLHSTVSKERRENENFAKRGLILCDRRQHREGDPLAVALLPSLIFDEQGDDSPLEKAKGIARRVLLTMMRECFATSGDAVLSSTVSVARLLAEWVSHYNEERPHQGLSPSGLTPKEVLRNLNPS